MKQKKEKVQPTKVQQLANGNLSAKEIFAKFSENTQGVLKSNRGTKKANIYKESLFTGTTDKEKKSLRRKFRNMLFSLCETITQEKSKDNLQKLVVAFNEFYSSAFVNNDYSLSSVCQENLNENKKVIIKKALEICKDSSK